MTRCRPEELDRWVAGELSGSEIAALWRHVAECRACDAELGALREEQLVFRLRALQSTPPVPEYADIAAKIRVRRERWVSATLSLTAACALFAAIVGGAPAEVSRQSVRASDVAAMSGGARPEPALLCEQERPLCEAPPMSWAPSMPLPETAVPIATEADTAPLCAPDDPPLSSGS